MRDLGEEHLLQVRGLVGTALVQALKLACDEHGPLGEPLPVHAVRLERERDEIGRASCRERV